MNTIAKVSVAGALALGYVSANAGVVVPTSSGPSGTDIMLFAEVVSGTTIKGSYAGDTQVAVSSSPGSFTDSTSTDSALASLISLGQSAGNTIEWGIMGGKFTLVGNPNAGDIYLTTLPSGASSLSGTIGTNLGSWSTGLQNTLQVVKSNAGTANSVFATTVAAGGIWDGTLATTATSNASNWFNNGASNVITGLGTATLYLVTSGASAATNTVAAEPGILTLSATGLTYTTAAPVPLPAAIWLLGGGLLGLFGIGRRKSATA